MNKKMIARRQLIRFLAASPLLAAAGPLKLFADATANDILSPGQALDVFDFQRAAKKSLPIAHYGYIATGTDGDETLLANRSAFDRLYLRAMRMVDTSRIDTSLELLGQELSSPIVLAPAGSQRAFHDQGELATARAARSRDHLQILSNVSTYSIEDVIEARGEPVWFQLYPTSDWSVATKMIRRAETAGAKVLVLTIDLNSDSNRLSLKRYIGKDTRDCGQCHDFSRPDHWLDRKPMYFETGATASGFDTSAMTWDYIDRLKEFTDMKVVVKGIVTAEDAESAMKSGADAVVVSNHGGRAEASGWATIDSLPEVVSAIGGEIPVMIDSGFRRGTDTFKALALGADAVCFGRAYLWGLAAFGQEGVERVLDILRAELAMVMGQMGTPSLADITARSVGRHKT